MVKGNSKKYLFTVKDFITALFGVYGIAKGLGSLLPAESTSEVVEAVKSVPRAYPRAFGFILLMVCAFMIGMTVLQMMDNFHRIQEESHRVVRLVQDSNKYFSYFSEWYGRKEPLTIITSDLDWVNKEESNAIYAALFFKSRQRKLTLLLDQAHFQRAQDDSSSLEYELKNEGAQVYVAPAKLVASYTFSCLFRGDYIKEIIVRNKANNQSDANREIVFEEIHDSQIFELLGALITEITKESAKEVTEKI